MAVIARGEIGLVLVKDIKSYSRFYLLQNAGSKVPSLPTKRDPTPTWSKQEPQYDGLNKDLYYTDLTEFSDGSFSYSPVSLSSDRQALIDLSKTIEGTNADIASLKDVVRTTAESITQRADDIESEVQSNYVLKDDLGTLKSDIETSISETSQDIRFDFKQITDEISGTVSDNQSKLEEYIRMHDGIIELGQVGNGFSAILSDTQLAFLLAGVQLAYFSDNAMKIADAIISNSLSIGQTNTGCFQIIPRDSGNLSIVWKPSA